MKKLLKNFILFSITAVTLLAIIVLSILGITFGFTKYYDYKV